LSHAVDGLDHLAAHLEALRVLALVAWRSGAVDDLTFFELALEVGRHEVPSPKTQVLASRNAGNESK
jgi:hypothetical protein